MGEGPAAPDVDARRVLLAENLAGLGVELGDAGPAVENDVRWKNANSLPSPRPVSSAGTEVLPYAPMGESFSDAVSILPRALSISATYRTSLVAPSAAKAIPKVCQLS